MKKKVGISQKLFLQKNLTQALDSHKRDELDVDYGKIPYVVPFPRQSLIGKLKDFQKEKSINAKSNLSAHGITLVYSDEKYEKGNKHTKKHIFIPLRVFDDGSDVVGVERSMGRYEILNRIKLGWDISRAQNMQAIFTKSKPTDFLPVEHSHSEQHFFSYIAKECLAVFELIRSQLPPGSKIYMIAFDMASLRTSCQCCRLSALASQYAQNEFVMKLQDFLKAQGFEIAGNKSSSGILLKATSRILAQNENNCDNGIPHKKPEQTNIKYSKNLLIFQSKEPGVFVSGHKDNAKKSDLERALARSHH